MATKTLGGDRLGTGAGIDVHLRNIDRANFDLNKIWRSSISPGLLVPFYCNIALPEDTFDIELKNLIRTLPTNGPLFGSYKCQMDMFAVPFRLYNGLLHNNMFGIGLDMQSVKLPKIKVRQAAGKVYQQKETYEQINPSSAMRYLGTAGLGGYGTETDDGKTILREINALPYLAYYDIFKNYYANKQEKYAFVMDADQAEINIFQSMEIKNVYGSPLVEKNYVFSKRQNVEDAQLCSIHIKPQPGEVSANTVLTFYFANSTDLAYFKKKVNENRVFIKIKTNNNRWYKISLKKSFLNVTDPNETKEISLSYMHDGELADSIIDINDANVTELVSDIVDIYGIHNLGTCFERNATYLRPWELKEWDKIRLWLLKNSDEGVTTYINDYDQNASKRENNPISAVYKQLITGNTASKFAQVGLVTKTYLSDIFNNWLDSEQIEGANGISAITRVDTSSGGFTIDALNLAQKVYKMLNRIAVSGGSYYDWIEAVYDNKITKIAETPVYYGGMSCEVTFDEIVSTAETSIGDNVSPLGTLGGRGKGVLNKGGKMIIKTDEPCIIMGILSLTPRVDYSQGNKWWTTELDSMDDLHKPQLDGIGFQDLMMERLNANTIIWKNEANNLLVPDEQQQAIGKQPAWIEYQTDYSECFGDFAIPDRAMYMTLNRRYSTDGEAGALQIMDATTYIDPSKYNYIFADTSMEAQNFWVQTSLDIMARRKMSAKIIPNL